MSGSNPPNQINNPLAAIPVYVTAGGSSPYVGTPLGYQQITLSAVEGLTPPAGATYAVITPATDAVNYRDDGTNPTATVGMPLAVGQVFTYAGSLTAIKFISQTGTAVLNVSYYK